MGGFLQGCHACSDFVATIQCMVCFRLSDPCRARLVSCSYSADVWSLGLVALECATACYPYAEASTYIEVHTIPPGCRRFGRVLWLMHAFRADV